MDIQLICDWTFKPIILRPSDAIFCSVSVFGSGLCGVVRALPTADGEYLVVREACRAPERTEVLFVVPRVGRVPRTHMVVAPPKGVPGGTAVGGASVETATGVRVGAIYLSLDQGVLHLRL